MVQESVEVPPPWLKAMQNGALGEARARAFLLNRFWILERSVDFQGADLFIQRRLTDRNLLDREPPRLGMVQVKFFGTSTTSHFIHREYVADREGEPWTEFFVLCHSGSESNPRTDLIFARDIMDRFPNAPLSGHAGYRITYKQLTATETFRVRDSRLALDRMERQLELAEFTKNRRFLSWALPSASPEIGAIEAEYREPLVNWWGDIPKGFTDIKNVARKAMGKVEHIHGLLLDVANTTDPAVAAERIDEIRYHCRGGDRHWSISLPDKLDDDEFFDVCRQHKVMVEHLRADGLLDAFIGMKETLSAYVVDFIAPRLPLSPTLLHRLSIRYNPATLVVEAVESKLEELADYLGMPVEYDGWRSIKGAPDFREHAIESAQLGRVDYHWLPGHWARASDGAKRLLETLQSGDSFLHRDCLDAVFACKYGEPHELTKQAGSLHSNAR